MDVLQDLHGVCAAQQALLERQGDLLDEQSKTLQELREELTALRRNSPPGTQHRATAAPGNTEATLIGKGRDDGSPAGQ